MDVGLRLFVSCPTVLVRQMQRQAGSIALYDVLRLSGLFSGPLYALQATRTSPVSLAAAMLQSCWA